MARLPRPGADNGTWGDILNDYLSQALAVDGQLKPDTVGSAQLKDNSVTNSAIAPNTITGTELASNAVTAAIIADGSITETLLDSSLQAKVNQTAPVTSVNTKTGVVTLEKTDVGLGNVDNTSDADKNSAIATLTNKTLDNAIISGTAVMPLNAGIQMYNTADQTTNYERVRQYWNGNVFMVATDTAGTGTSRSIQVNGAASYITLAGTGVTLGRSSTTTPNVVTAQATLTASSSTQSLFTINPTVTQSGSAGYVALKVNATETSTGSGTKLLADFQVGGVSKAKIDNTGVITAAAGTLAGNVVTVDGTQTLTNKTISSANLSGTITAPQGNNIYIYNSVDQTTNYERVATYWSSNVFTIFSGAGGTGTPRPIRIVSGNATFGINELTQSLVFTRNTPSVITTLFDLNTSGSGLSGVSGVQYGVRIFPTINQTSTAGYTMLLINPTESSVGSGNRLLIDAQVGGTSKFAVDNSGTTVLSNTAALSIYNTADQTTNYERARHYWSSNIYTIGLDTGGAGTNRHLQLQATSVTMQIRSSGATSTGLYRFLNGTAAAGGYGIEVSGNYTATSGTGGVLAIVPNINQSSTAGYNAILVNVTETAVGSGAKLLANLQVGGASKVTIDNTGIITTAAAGTAAGSVVTVDGTQTLTNKTLSGMNISGDTTLPQNSVIQLYNTVDQTTNFERGKLFWSSNVLTLATDSGGAGANRLVQIKAASVTFTVRSSGASNAGLYQFSNGTSAADGHGVRISGTYTPSSGRTVGLSVEPTLNQTGTAGYTALLVNPTETATGSGTKLLADFQVAGVSKVTVDTAGVITASAGTAAGSVVTVDGTQTLTNKTFSALSLSGSTLFPQNAQLQLYNTVDQTTNYERVRHFWTNNVYTIATDVGGSGTARAIELKANSVALRIRPAGSASGLWEFASGLTSANNVGVNISGSYTPSSGVNPIMAIQPTINQTGTAGYTALLINPTETTVGSGMRLLADFQVGGVSKVSITNLGQLKLAVSTANSATMNIPTGTAPTSPTTGDIYSDGTHVYCYLAGTWKQLD